MTRKLALAMTACLGLVHQAAWALGLGDIEVDSALNQPFEATIELRNEDGLESNEIIASLASAEDFERVGVERFFFLSDLAFRTDLSDPDAPVIRVTSNQPVTEPFVNFVVQVLWPSGRLLKEFTILLDPPTYADRPVNATDVPAASAVAQTRASRTPVGTRVRTSEPPTPAPARGAFSGDSYGDTDRDDTLWAIALEVRPERSLSVQQTMLALLRLNPEAFIGGNINRLKAGYALRVPDADEIRRLSFEDAIVQVREQNDRWRAGLDRAPLDARSTAVAAGGRTAASSGELRLVSSSGDRTAAQRNEQRSAAGAAAAGSRGAAGLAAELDATRSQLDAAQRQATALRGARDDAVARAAELERQIQVRDEQIARLQAAVTEQLEADGARPESSASASTPAAAGGLFGIGWATIGAALGALVLVGALVLLFLRRLSRSDADDDTAFAPVAADVPEPMLEPGQAAAAQSGAALAGDDHGVSPEVDTQEEGEDVLAEADVYMAYGNFTEAAAALGAALEADPNRADIRLKLLEVHVEQGDVDAFDEQARALRDIGDASTIEAADELASRLPGATASSGEITSGETVLGARAGGGVSLDFDLADDARTDDGTADLDSLDIDLDLDGLADDDADALDVGLDADLADASRSDAADELELELDLDGELAAGDGALDFDLDLDDLDDGADGEKPDDDARPLGLADDDALAGGGTDDGRLELSLDGDDADDGALPDLDFELPEDIGAGPGPKAGDGDAPGDLAATLAEGSPEGDLDDLDFDIGDLAADDDALRPTSDAVESGTLPGIEVPGDDDDFEFDIDDLEYDESGNGAGDELAELDAGDDAGAPADRASVPPEGGDPASIGAGVSPLDAELDFELDEDFDFSDESDTDEITTKLELARAYVDMGDEEGAREILDEVVRDGDDGQKKEAGELLAQIG